MAETSKILQVKAQLKDEALERFTIIKQKLGVATDAEVVRYLIKQEYERILNQVPVKVDPQTAQEIDQFLQSSGAQFNYEDRAEVIRDAVKHWLPEVLSSKKYKRGQP